MNWNRLVRRIGRRIPGQLRDLRGRMLLSGFAAHAGEGEVPCRACGGRGSLSPTRWRRCPICMGFQEVPRKLDFWFQREALSLQEPDRPAPPAGAVVPNPGPPAPRIGLAGELAHRVSHWDLAGMTLSGT